MPPKKGSRPVFMDGSILDRLDAYLETLGWTWGRTKYIERLIELECAGELYRLDGKAARQRQAGEKFLFGKAGPTTVEGEAREPDQQRGEGK